jgi:hypothetical protein
VIHDDTKTHALEQTLKSQTKSDKVSIENTTVLFNQSGIVNGVVPEPYRYHRRIIMAISLKLLAGVSANKKEKARAKENQELERTLAKHFTRGNISLQNGNFVTKAEKISRIEKLAARKRS